MKQDQIKRVMMDTIPAPKLTTTMNFKNSFDPQIGSRNFPANINMAILTTPF